MSHPMAEMAGKMADGAVKTVGCLLIAVFILGVSLLGTATYLIYVVTREP